MRPAPHPVEASTYSPLDSFQALKSPKSKELLLAVRTGVSAVGRAPLAGTSHIRGPNPLVTPQVARTVVELHQRTAMQLSVTPGTGSFLITPPALLISFRPFRAPTASSVPLELSATEGKPPLLTVSRFFCSLPVRLYRCTVTGPTLAPGAALSATMFSPSGLV